MTPAPKSSLKSSQSSQTKSSSKQQSLVPTRALPTLVYQEIDPMGSIFEITNVAGDGNCGYYVFQKKLEAKKEERILSVADDSRIPDDTYGRVVS
jgi:hypothetical protein